MPEESSTSPRNKGTKLYKTLRRPILANASQAWILAKAYE